MNDNFPSTYVEQMNTAYALYKGFWEATEKTPILGVNWNSCYYRFDALWMPPAISQKEEHFQSYRSGYHEDAPALDGLFEKAHFISCDEICNLECVFLDFKQYQLVITL